MATQLCVAVFSTEANNRAQYTIKTLRGLIDTVNFNKHRLVICDNASCNEIQAFYIDFMKLFEALFPIENLVIICSPSNDGTSVAINKCLKRLPDGYFPIKIDDDVMIHQKGWVEEMEECFVRQPKLGILGLKRVDLEQSPNNTNPHYKTELVELPRKKGQSWLTVEVSDDIIGTCTMFNPMLFKKIGYMFQDGLYAFDDNDYAQRSLLSGFANAFLPHIKISHLDTGVLEGGEKTDFIIWKQQIAGEKMQGYANRVLEYKSGKRSLYYNPFTDNENI